MGDCFILSPGKDPLPLKSMPGRTNGRPVRHLYQAPADLTTQRLKSRQRHAAWPVGTLILLLLLALVTSGAAQGDTTERVSVSSAGAQGDNDSFSSSTSADGRYVAFSSYTSNLVPNDTNGSRDVFVRDRLTGETRQISVSSAGVQGNGSSFNPSISTNGRYVAFQSYATNLAADDTNGVNDVFVRDRLTGETKRVSLSSVGVQGDNDSFNPSISADGRYVAFDSDATNLVSGDTNGWSGIFVRDRLTGETKRVSLSSAGVQGNGNSFNPSISADGRYVAFFSGASNLAAGDTNGVNDVFVRDRLTGETKRVSLSSVGVQGDNDSFNPSISADGRYVAFDSDATNLVSGDTNGWSDLFVYDRLTGQTERVGVSSVGVQGDGNSLSPSISADGRYVAFESDATSLATDDTNSMGDVFVRDRLTGETERVSLSSTGVQGNSFSYFPSISADGRYVAFFSGASNLVSGDTNGWSDIFVRVRDTLLPIANFSWSPAVPVMGQEVAFFDASTGAPTAYEWDFNGDGVTDSELTNPVHIFGASGSYLVELEVCNAAGCDTAADTVTVGSPAQVDSALITQPLTATGTFPSQQYEPAHTASNALAADDFTVPAGGWSIGQVEALGHYEGGSGPAPFVNVKILKDAGGIPGLAACTYSGLVAGTDYTDSNGHFLIVLPTPCSLTPGTYWFTIQADMDFSAGGWRWGASLPVSGSPAQWQNPANGWGKGCTGWTSVGACFGLGGRDLAMVLRGPCSFGAGALKLTSLTVDTSTTYQACLKISASEMQITGSATKVTLQAGEGVALGSGFSVKKGASLHVVVGPASP